MISPAARKRLYREGRRLLGPDRMARLRDRSRRAAGAGARARRRASAAREALRPTPWASVRAVVALDPTAVLLDGRIGLGPSGALADGASLELELDDGTTVDASADLHRYTDRAAQRTDGATTGFVIRADVGAERRPRALVVRLPGGRRHVARCPPTTPFSQDPGGAVPRVAALLEPLGRCVSGGRALLDAVLGPALERAWEAGGPVDGAAAGRSARTVRHNPELAPADPLTSIVVPVYGRHDFIEHQLVHFARDPEIRASELIYVIDDPRLHAAIEADAARLAAQHPIAFTLVHLDRNLGYAGANNAGAAIARGRYLLLLNSDVLPAAPGWLGRMRGAAGPDLARRVLGARLLYDDDGVQHDGMRFEPGERFEGLWQNRHPGKGLPDDLFETSPGALPREAVTGACLHVSRAAWDALGGLDEGYVLGDFEDSDFCLKARRAGLDVAIAPQARLYHLERQSQSLVTSAPWKRALTHYNCWRHHRRWDADIVALRGARA